MAIEIIDGFKVNKGVPIDTQRSVVTTLAERNAIPTGVRYEGLETRVVATRTKYVLEGGVANANWKPMVNNSIPDYAFSSIEEIRTLDLTAIDSAVDLWLYPTRVYEWDAFSLLPDNNDTVIKPDGVAEETFGRFVLRAELAVKNHTHLPEPSHYDNGVVSENGKVRLGGRLSQKREIAFDTIFDLSQTVFNSHIRAFVKLDDGKYLVGGIFTMCNGVSVEKIARLNANGSLDQTFDLYLDGAVRGFHKLADGAVLVYGDFFSINFYSDIDGSRSVMTGPILKLTPTANFDSTFIPTFFDGSINAIAIQSDGKIIVGGTMSSRVLVAGGRPVGARQKINRLFANGGYDDSFAFDTVRQFGATGIVYSICIVEDDSMMVGGQFTSYNSYLSDNTVKLKKDGTVDGSFGSKSFFGGAVYDIKKTSTGNYLVCGAFTSYSGNIYAAKFTRILANGDLDTSFNKLDLNSVSTDNTVQGLVDIYGDGTKFYAFGSFSIMNSVASNRIAVIDAITGMVNQDGFKSPLSASSSNVLSVCNTGEFLFYSVPTGFPLFGAFTQSGSLYIKFANIAFDGFLEYMSDLSSKYTDLSLIHKAYLLEKIKNFVSEAPNDGQTYVRQSLAWSVLKVLNGLKYENGQITIGGDITRNTTINNLKTRLLFDNGFKINGGSTTLLGIAKLSTGDLIIIGRQLVYNGLSKAINDHIVKIGRFGEYSQLFRDNLGSEFQTELSFVMPLADGKMLAHGGQLFNGVWNNYLIKLNADGTLDSAFIAPKALAPPSVIGKDTIVQLSNGSIVVSFLSNPSTGACSLINLNATTGAVIPDYIANDRVFNGAIYGLTKLPDDGVLAVGSFTTFYSQPFYRIAKFTPMGSTDRSFITGSGFDANAEAATVQPDGKILVMGRFRYYDNTLVQNIVRLNTNGALDTTFNPTFLNTNGGTMAFVKVLPDGRIIIGGNFRCADNINFLRVMKADGTLDTSFGGGKTILSASANAICIHADKMTIIGSFLSCLENSSWVTVNGIANFTFDGKLIRDNSKLAIAGFPIEYAEDQSINYTDRSLVDKGFVATQLSDKVRKKEFKGIVISKSVPFDIIHNLGVRPVRVSVFDESTWAMVACDTICTDINKVSINVTKSNIASSTIIIEG